jgi:hypothetical protein
MSSRDDRRDDDLDERLDELEDVLSELRRDLRSTERDRREPRSPPRPPRLAELVRFTEQYTIPTVIALLETTITSLELLRGTLRLLDPGRDVNDGTEATGGRLADVQNGAASGLARSLSELRAALSEADLPEEAASRSIIEEARNLTAEIESRIDESRQAADAARRKDADAARRQDRDGRRTDDRGRAGDDRRRRDGQDRPRREDSRDGAVHIDVTDPDASRDDTSADGSDAALGSDVTDENPPAVDVESELESIKSQLDAPNDGDDAADDGDDAPNDGDDTRDDGDGPATGDDR